MHLLPPPRRLVPSQQGTSSRAKIGQESDKNRTRIGQESDEPDKRALRQSRGRPPRGLGRPSVLGPSNRRRPPDGIRRPLSGETLCPGAFQLPPAAYPAYPIVGDHPSHAYTLRRPVAAAMAASTAMVVQSVQAGFPSEAEGAQLAEW